MVPKYEHGKDYYAVFFHGVYNIAMPFDTTTNWSTIPAEFDAGRGITLAAISDTPWAPTLDSVVAEPLVLPQQPEGLAVIDA